MRLSDIFKKNNGKPSQQSPVPVTADKPVEFPLPPPQEPQQPKTESFTPIPVQQKKTSPLPPLQSAEQIYTEAIIETKNIFSAMQKGDIFPAQIQCLQNIIRLLDGPYEDLLFLAGRATPDMYLYGHSVNVCILSLLIGKGLNLDNRKLLVLGYCALLHDIGMAKILDLAAKNEKFSAAEHNQIKKHVLYGQEMLRKFTGISEEFKLLITKVIYQTHERKNGAGYPEGLKGSEIHEFARIITIADVYEALTHPRSYRDLIIPHEAVKMIINNAEEDFDSEMVKVFVEHISLYPPGSYIRLNTDEIARVIGTREGLPTRPKVQVIIDASGQRIAAPKVVDLSAAPMLFIKEPVDETKMKLTDKKLALELKAMRWWVKGL